MSDRFDVIRDIEYRPTSHGSAAQSFDLFRPDAPSLPGAFIFMHGGGWRYGDKSSSEQVPAALAAAGITTINANYTLTSDHPYPRNIDDVFALIDYVSQHGEALDIRSDGPALLGIGGSSSGGHLASLAVTKGLAEGRLVTRPAAVVSWFAPLDPPSRYLKHRYPDAPYPGGFWDRVGREPSSPPDPFVPFIGSHDFDGVSLRAALDGDPRLHLADLSPDNLPPFLLLVGSRDSDEIRYSQRTWHGALRSVGAQSTLLEVADADHADPLFSTPPLIGAVTSHLAAAVSARTTSASLAH